MQQLVVLIASLLFVECAVAAVASDLKAFTLNDLSDTANTLSNTSFKLFSLQSSSITARFSEDWSWGSDSIISESNRSQNISVNSELFVLDPFQGNDVLKFDGQTGVFLEPYVEGFSRLSPASMVFGGLNNNLFISQNGGGSVWEYDLLTGDFIGEFVATGSGGLSRPSGLAFGPNGGNLFVADTSSSKILEFSVFDGSYVGDFAFLSGMLPGEIAFFNSNLFVIDQAASAVQRFDSQGTYQGVFVSNLDSAADFVFGPNGNLFITVGDFQLGRVDQYDGVTGAFIGTFASGNGLSNPTGLAFGPDGNLYVADSDTSSILEFNGSTGAYEGIFVPTGSGDLGSPDDILFQEIPEPVPGFMVPMLSAFGLMAWQFRKRKLG
ncbi:NHL repeat-containing protein [Gloeobacter violaceus]|nr:NHL repeat-containing protein [Gloeobacter violaceus]